MIVILFFSLAISLEKYIKIINNPLISIRNVMIEYKKLKDHSDIMIQINLEYNKSLIVKKIGWIFIIVSKKIMRIHDVNIKKKILFIFRVKK